MGSSGLLLWLERGKRSRLVSPVRAKKSANGRVPSGNTRYFTFCRLHSNVYLYRVCMHNENSLHYFKGGSQIV